MFADPQFWVAVSFAIFIILVFKPISKILNSSLDTKIQDIKNQIQQAEKIKNEMQVEVSNIKKRQNEVKLEIEEININAKERIKYLESDTLSKLNQQKIKRKQLANAKIDQMTRDANLSIKNYITQISILSVKSLLEEQLNENEKQKLINKSIEELGLVLKN
tara:strand:+ start:601 stop:1086 length:486 start_codon:yes stop_codon:yes gene_type:complete